MLAVYTKVDEIRNEIAQLALVVATEAANAAGDKMRQLVTEWGKEGSRRFKGANAETALANKEAAGNFFGISKRIKITPAFSFA